ncbi:MAG: hypothetical protein KDG54_11850 [Geminicoccaceae bacterium]|nr:hypothetical protein [Geminicoccaceae bacterium]
MKHGDLLAAWLFVLFVLTGCGRDEVPARPESLPEVAAPQPQTSVVPEPPPSMCDSMARLVEAMRGGFASLRAGTIEANWRWSGAEKPYPFVKCEIEGTTFPTAVYRCQGSPVRMGRTDILESSFADLEHAIQACLQRPTWYPRDWREGSVYEFAGAEKQLMWRDVSARPAAAFILAVTENAQGNRMKLDLTLRTFR